MGFFDRAWDSAADEYGRKRAEKYGAVARMIRAVQVVVIVVLATGIIAIWAGR